MSLDHQKSEFKVEFADNEVIDLNDEDLEGYLDDIDVLGSQIDTQFNKMM